MRCRVRRTMSLLAAMALAFMIARGWNQPFFDQWQRPQQHTNRLDKHQSSHLQVVRQSAPMKPQVDIQNLDPLVRQAHTNMSGWLSAECQKHWSDECVSSDLGVFANQPVALTATPTSASIERALSAVINSSKLEQFVSSGCQPNGLLRRSKSGVTALDQLTQLGLCEMTYREIYLSFSQFEARNGRQSEQVRRTIAALYLSKFNIHSSLGEPYPVLPEPHGGWPSVTITVPTCFHRRKFHGTLYKMLKHQDYPGPLDFIVLDGKCGSASACNSGMAGLPSPVFHGAGIASSDSRLKYYRDGHDVFLPTPLEVGDIGNLEQNEKQQATLGTKRSWLAQNATGDIIVNMDDDDYYAPHYVRTMVHRLITLDVDLLKLISWITYAEAFRENCAFSADLNAPAWPGYVRTKATSGQDRCPLIQWQEQDGFGWGWTYVYRRKWALEHQFSSSNRNEEKGLIQYFLVEPFKDAQRDPNFGAAKDQNGQWVLRSDAASFAAVPDREGLALRISTRSCIRATGSLAIDRCYAMHEKAMVRQQNFGEYWLGSMDQKKFVDTRNDDCRTVSPAGPEAPWLAMMIYGTSIFDWLLHFPEVVGAAPGHDAESAIKLDREQLAFRHQHVAESTSREVADLSYAHKVKLANSFDADAAALEARHK